MLDTFPQSKSLLCVMSVAQIAIGAFIPVSRADAQSAVASTGVTVSGSGPETYVLISGMIGGVAGYRRLGRLLVGEGNRVVTIDPYQLSLDSTRVSFDDLARRVDAELARRGIVGARVIGHAHGGGVALRLAANSPHRVSELILLDVGALALNKSAVFSSSIRLIPLISRLPFGRDFIRGRFVRGLRENSGGTEWLDDSTKRAYTEPFIDNIRKIIALAVHLAKAEEPESLPAVVGRVRVPVTVLLGEFKRAAGPNPDEMTSLQFLRTQLRIEKIRGAGHFPHEESPYEVVKHVSRRALLAEESSGQR